MREDIITSQFHKNLTRKTTSFEGWFRFKLSNLGLALGMTLKFTTSVEKGSKLKVRRFLSICPKFVEVTGEKLVGGLFAPILKMGKKNSY